MIQINLGTIRHNMHNNNNFVSACHFCALFFRPVKKSYRLLKKITTLVNYQYNFLFCFILLK